MSLLNSIGRITESSVKEMSKLLNIKVEKVYVSNDQSEVYLQTENKEIWKISTESECCSETWFADIIGVESILGRRIKDVEILHFPREYSADERTRQVEDLQYGFRIIIDCGYCEFIYRNSSNGHYGGSIGEITLSSLPDSAIEITSDWSA